MTQINTNWYLNFAKNTLKSSASIESILNERCLIIRCKYVSYFINGKTRLIPYLLTYSDFVINDKIIHVIEAKTFYIDYSSYTLQDWDTKERTDLSNYIYTIRQRYIRNPKFLYPFATVPEISFILKWLIVPHHAIIVKDGYNDLETLETYFKVKTNLYSIIDLNGTYGKENTTRLFMIKKLAKEDKTNFEADSIKFIKIILSFFRFKIEYFMNYFAKKYPSYFDKQTFYPESHKFAKEIDRANYDEIKLNRFFTGFLKRINDHYK